MIICLLKINAAQRKRKYRQKIKEDSERWNIAREKQREWSRQWREKNKIECEKNDKKRELYREKERMRKRRQREKKKLRQMQQQGCNSATTTPSMHRKYATELSNRSHTVTTPIQADFLPHHLQNFPVLRTYIVNGKLKGPTVNQSDNNPYSGSY